MKAEKTRDALVGQCQACGRVKEIMSTGICAPVCGSEYRLDEEYEKELTELEYLAEIGRATVAQYGKGFMLIKQKGNLTTAFLTVKDIVDWHHREDNNG